MRLIASRRGVLTLALALSPGLAGASLISFAFEGTVDNVSGSALDPTFNTSQTLSGVYTFESTTPDDAGSVLNGDYQQAVTALSATIGAYAFAASGGAADGDLSLSLLAQHSYNFDFDAGVTGSLTGSPVGGLGILSFKFDLRDTTGNAFSSDVLPLTPPDLGLFDAPTWRLNFTGSQKFVEGTLTSLSIAPEPVPLPASAWLFGAGLLGLIAAGRRHGRMH